MSNEALLIYKKMGLSEESDFAAGTITAATKLLPLRDSGVAIGLGQNVVMPKRISGRASLKDSFLGTKAPKLGIPFFGYPTGIGLKLLKAAFGQVSSTEIASFIVTAHTSFVVQLNTNDYIDFKEGAGDAKAAQIAAGTYTAFELCAAIKAAMEAANDSAVTYSVTFSTTTKKFTITPSASTIDLLWASGTNNAKAADTLLGFSADITASAAATSAVAVTHADANDAIDFTEDGGSEITAFLTAGTYKAGATHADSGTLCELIKTQMEAVNGAATYSVSFSTTTKKFTITKDSGVFVLKTSSGENAGIGAGALLGYAADSSSAIAATSDTAVEIVWDHVFTPLDATPYGMSKALTLQIGLATGKVFDVLDAVVDVFKMSYKPNQEVFFDAEVEARVVSDSSADLAALTEESTDPFLYSQLAFTIGGSSHDLSGLDLTLNNNLKKDLYGGAAARLKFPRNDFREISGSFTLPLADSQAYAIYTAFLAGTNPALQAIFTGGTIKGSLTYTMTLDLYKVQYAPESVPGGGGVAAPEAPIPFKALHDGTNGDLKITIRNNEGSI